MAKSVKQLYRDHVINHNDLDCANCLMPIEAMDVILSGGSEEPVEIVWHHVLTQDVCCDDQPTNAMPRL